MNASFHVTVDPARDLVRITLTGFFTPELMADFIHARAAAHTRLCCGPNRHVTLVDARDMAIQAQELVTRFQGVLADPAYRSRRLAIVTPSSLARLQAYRAAGNRDARFFTELEEAQAWVLEQGQAEAKAA